MQDPRDSTIRELEKRLAESEGRPAEFRRAKERKATAAALVEAGVYVHLAGSGAAHMAELSMIGTDEAGAVVAVQSTPRGAEHVPLADGVAAYLKTTTGKGMLAASEAATGKSTRTRTMTPALAAEVLGARPRPAAAPSGQRLTMTPAWAAEIIGELSRG